jgi:hypothetical protein
MKKIPEFLRLDKDLPSDFLTEGTGTGDVTVPVILDRVCVVLMVTIVILGVIVLAHAALWSITGEWL